MRKVWEGGKRHKMEEKILNGNILPTGYKAVILSLDGDVTRGYVHRFVAMAFIKRDFESLVEVNHKNGIKHDNRVENLEWCTPSQNMKHSYDTRLRLPQDLRGERNPSTKYTRQRVEEIKAMSAEGIKDGEIARRFNMPFGTVWCITHGRTWKCLNDKTYRPCKTD